MSRMVLLNSSPLQYLHQLGLIDILKQLFGNICVPAEVQEELSRGIEEGIDLPRLQRIGFINVLELKETILGQLVRDLGKGETAVILYGLENPGSLIVLDDLLARRVARGLGVHLTGTAGLLISAKMKGILETVKPHLDELEHLGFRLAREHRSIILKKAGEDEA